MRASLLVRAGSLAAAAAIATTGAMAATGAADAATAAPHKLPTHLAIAKRPATLHHKRVTLIAGQLRSHRVPLRDKVVYLDRRTAGTKWTVVGKAVTGRLGRVAFVVTPKVKAQFVLVFRGNPNFRASHSRVIDVRPRG